MLPHYLNTKLAAIGIHSHNELLKHDYLKVFSWLQYTFPSLNYKALYDLYKLTRNDDQIIEKSLTKEDEADLRHKYKIMIPSYPPLPQSTILHFLQKAEELAVVAEQKNEIPIGTVVVKDDIDNNQQINKKIEAKLEPSNFSIIGSGANATLEQNNIMAHAEIIAITNAQNTLSNHRLTECDLYVTIEPCLMCMGAILNSRIRRVIFGAVEPKTGAIISQYKVLHNKNVNHQTEAIGPIDNEYYSSIVRNFMRNKR